MKRILFLLVTVVLTLITSHTKAQLIQQSNLQATQKPSKPVVLANVETIKSIPKTPEKPKIEAPAPIVVPPPKTCASEVQKYDWNKQVAHAVMMAESSGDASELNDTPATGDYSVGCFQVNIYKDLARNRPSEAELKNPEVNVQWAYNHYKALGNTFGTTAGWGAFNSGAYLKYL